LGIIFFVFVIDSLVALLKPLN